MNTFNLVIELGGHPHRLTMILKNETLRSSTRPLLIFLHGWGGSSAYWMPTATSMAEHYDCLLYDLKGFGSSRPEKQSNSEFSFKSYALELEQLIQKSRESKSDREIYLIAHSMGCSIALNLEKSILDSLEGIILTCHGLPTVPDWHISTFAAIASKVIKIRYSWLRNVPHMDRVFVSRFLESEIEKAARSSLLLDYLRADSIALKKTLLESFKKESFERLSQVYADLEIPTLQLSGAKDRIIRPEWGEEAAARNALIRWKAIEGSGHFPMLENAALFEETVKNFLSSSRKN